MANEEQPQNVSEEILEDDQVTLNSQIDEHAEDNGNDSGLEGGAMAARIEELEQALAQAKEQAMRAAAEVQNVRRRAELDVEKAHKFALDKFVGDLLPVADNLERAVASSVTEGANIEAITEGVELTLKSMVDALSRHKVVALNPEGEPFNPEMHQAMTMVESADCEPNSVLNVFQKGYTLNERLVRPAMVVVSKAPSK